MDFQNVRISNFQSRNLDLGLVTWHTTENHLLTSTYKLGVCGYTRTCGFTHTRGSGKYFTGTGQVR